MEEGPNLYGRGRVLKIAIFPESRFLGLVDAMWPRKRSYRKWCERWSRLPRSNARKTTKSGEPLCHGGAGMARNLWWLNWSSAPGVENWNDYCHPQPFHAKNALEIPWEYRGWINDLLGTRVKNATKPYKPTFQNLHVHLVAGLFDLDECHVASLPFCLCLISGRFSRKNKV